MPSAAAWAFNVGLRHRAAQTSAAVLSAFAAVDGDDIDGTFAKVRLSVMAAIAKGQLLGAVTAYAYHLGLLGQAGISPSGPAILPAGFAAGMLTSAGLPLPSVIALAPVYAKQQIGQGLAPAAALKSSGGFLATVADSEVQDSARGVMDIALNTDDAYDGYVRVPDPGACDRCLILAGRHYATDADFARHPRCGCSSEPSLAGHPRPQASSPRELFDGMSREQQDRSFGVAGAEAAREPGADLSRIVNAKSGMSSAGDSFTTALASKHRGQRLSPIGCRRLADGDQGKYLSLLKLNGYIV